MIEGRTIAVIVPAHNEVALIGATLEAMPDFVDHIVVVDDGSDDGTAQRVRACGRPVELIRHSVNRGVGAAIASGCVRARALRFDITTVMAADRQMHPDDLRSLVTALISNEADFVKGDRLSWPRARVAMPWQRWIGNRFLSWATGLALNMPLSDSQCGYIALNQRALAAIAWNHLWRGYGYPNDLLCQVARRRLRLCEVTVRPVYGQERSGIRLHHALATIPLVILRAWVRRHLAGAIESPWPTSTSSMVTPTGSAHSPSSATPSRAKAL